LIDQSFDWTIAAGAMVVGRKIQSFTPHHFFSKARLGQRCEAFIDRVEQLIHNPNASARDRGLFAESLADAFGL
jgi:hypothetical protein